MYKIGLIVNPLAGLGGPAAQKGSDSPDIREIARELHIVPLCSRRALYVFNQLPVTIRKELYIYTAGGEMGENLCKELGLSYELVLTDPGLSCASDTETCAARLLEKDISILVFSGGDGTARNICHAVGDKLMVLGIPAGVKMHSGVFALHLMQAAHMLSSYLSGHSLSDTLAEVIDLDENAYIHGDISTKLYGYLRTPFDNNNLQGTKISGYISDQHAELALTEFILEEMESYPDCCFAVGAGKTTFALKKRLCESPTLLGIDIFLNKTCVRQDANVNDLIRLSSNHPFRLVISPIGGQGYLFGRGNQQFSPEFLKKIEKQHVYIIATPQKISSFYHSGMLVDTGLPSLDAEWKGYTRVHTGYRDEVVMKINFF